MKPKFLYLLLGLLGLLASSGAFVVAVAAPSVQVPEAVSSAALCGLVLLVPGLYFLFLWWRLRSREELLRKTGALLDAYRSVPLTVVAEKLGLPVADAEQLVALAIKEGYARGRIDPSSAQYRAEGIPEEPEGPA